MAGKESVIIYSKDSNPYFYSGEFVEGNSDKGDAAWRRMISKYNCAASLYLISQIAQNDFTKNADFFDRSKNDNYPVLAEGSFESAKAKNSEGFYGYRPYVINKTISGDKFMLKQNELPEKIRALKDNWGKFKGLKLTSIAHIEALAMAVNDETRLSKFVNNAKLDTMLDYSAMLDHFVKFDKASNKYVACDTNSEQFKKEEKQIQEVCDTFLRNITTNLYPDPQNFD